MTFPLIVAALVSTPIGASQEATAASPYAVVKQPEGEVQAPLFSERYASLAVASVEGQPITLARLAEALAGTHEARTESAKVKQTKDFTPVLDRLIGARLVLLEAHEMGLDELPEFKADMTSYAESTARRFVQERATRDVKPDPTQVERFYQEAVREWKVKSVLFAGEEDAKAFSLALRGGKKFDDLAREAIAAKKCEGDLEGQVLNRKTRALPQVLQAVESLEKGGASRAVRVEKGWAVLFVDDVRYPEDAQARSVAESQSRGMQNAMALRRYYDGMVRQYARVDQKLLKRLDFEAKKPGFAALEKDGRVLARIVGDRPLTVADLAAGFRASYFHGVEEAIKEKKINAQKVPLLDALLSKRLVALEARRLKVTESAEYKKALADHRESFLFGFFVDRVVAPDIAVPEKEGLAHYEAHKSEYSYPEFYKLSSIGFLSAKAAQKAVSKLRSGTDFKWLKVNAEDQLEGSFRAIDYNGETVIASSLQPELEKVLAGSRAGDVRLWSASRDQHYVLLVRESTPKRPQPYSEVRAGIVKKLYADHLGQAIETWIAKLRKAHDVKVYITRIGS